MSNKTDAWPTILINLSEIFHALQVSREIFTFLLSSFLADWVGFVDIINAKDLDSMRTFLIWDCGNEGDKTKKSKELHEIDIL